MTLDELAHLLDVELRITSSVDDNGKISIRVKFPHAEIKDGIVLASATGFGKTLAQARKNYAREIAGKRLVFDAYGEFRREFNIPSTLK